MFKEKSGFKNHRVSYSIIYEKYIFLTCILFTYFNNPIYAISEFKTREEADKFLNHYYIDVVKLTKVLYKTRNISKTRIV